MGIKICYCNEKYRKSNLTNQVNQSDKNLKTNNDNLTNIENIDIFQTQTPLDSGKKNNINKEEKDDTNLIGDKTDIGESHNQDIINNEQPANRIDTGNIQNGDDANDKKEENGTENKNRIEPLKLNNPSDIQGLLNNKDELVQSTSGTLIINSKTNIFVKNKSIYSYNQNNNINNFQGKISSNQYADSILPQINEQEERN
jgi:hypothetical protein